ncbi:hypothetical protein CRUP_021896 [Coryphaenoides rupestris]|nr:hypothetical protein CRUP_021896 [Coryphaenoides rupestris]
MWYASVAKAAARTGITQLDQELEDGRTERTDMADVLEALGGVPAGLLPQDLLAARVLGMSGGRQRSLFFIGLPDQDKLCAVSLSFQGGAETEDHRSRQIKTCRKGVPDGERLEDFDFPPMVLKNFSSQRDCVLHTSSMGGPNWCYVLPSMKRGRIMSISHQLPADSPFKSYQDLQEHWRSLPPGRPSAFLQPGGMSCRGERKDQRAVHTYNSSQEAQTQSSGGEGARSSSASATTNATSQSSSSSAQPSYKFVVPLKVVSIFTNRSRHINLTQLLAQKQQSQKKGKEGERFESKPKRSRPTIQDVESLARNNQGCRSSGSLVSVARCRDNHDEHPQGPQPSYKFVVPLKVVSIFTNRSRHINLTQLLAQKQQSQKKGKEGCRSSGSLVSVARCRDNHDEHPQGHVVSAAACQGCQGKRDVCENAEDVYWYRFVADKMGGGTVITEGDIKDTETPQFPQPCTIGKEAKLWGVVLSSGSSSVELYPATSRLQRSHSPVQRVQSGPWFSSPRQV